MNELSSRSHAVFIIIAENSVIKDVDQTEDKVADQEAGKTRQSFKVGKARENERFDSRGLLFALNLNRVHSTVHPSVKQSASPDGLPEADLKAGKRDFITLRILPIHPGCMRILKN